MDNSNNVTFTTATRLIGDNCEALAFNDGHVEIEDPGRNFQEIPTLPNISLNRDQAIELRNFLNATL